YDSLVRLTGADHSGVRPHRNPSPLPFLDHFGVGLLDETSDPSERRAPPITQLLDSRIYQPRGRVSLFSFLRAALPLLYGCLRFLHGCCRSPPILVDGPVVRILIKPARCLPAPVRQHGRRVEVGVLPDVRYIVLREVVRGDAVPI